MSDPTGRILILQLYRLQAPALLAPRFDVQLGVLIATLRREGYEISVLAADELGRAELHAEVLRLRPDVIYADVAPTAPDLARRVLGDAHRRYGLHAVAGGLFAAVEPEAVLSYPGIEAVVVGEPEQALPRYLREHLCGEPGEPVPGIWYRDERGVVRTSPHPLTIDLDKLPFADRSAFGRPATSGQATCHTVSVGRGCPLRCAYCPNERLASLYADEAYVRRRSPDNICDEIDEICLADPDTDRLRFDDHLFALDEPWLAEFAAVYSDRCGVPFECHLRAQYVTERVADLLAAAGCALAEVHVVSGSDFTRNEILAMEVSDEQLARAFGILQQRGISTRAISFVGEPYATEVSLAALEQLDRRIRPCEHQVRVFHPLAGTRALDLCREAGWLSNRGERCLSEQRSVLDMPNLPATVIDQTVRRLQKRLGANGTTGFWSRLGRTISAPGRRLAGLFSSASRHGMS